MLTTIQIEKLRKRLLEERARLRRDESTVPSESEPSEGDLMDEAEANLERDEALERAVHNRSRLEEIERALEKMDEGTYGVSELSGEPIDFARLEAIPWAHVTAVEQEDQERSQKQRRS